MIPTKVIDLGDGDSAELYIELRHGTSRRVQDIYRPYLMKPEVKKTLESADEEGRIAKLFDLIGNSVDVTVAADILIIGQVKTWTFGGQILPVTQETLDNEVTEKKRGILAKEANLLYSEIPLPLSGVGK